MSEPVEYRLEQQTSRWLADPLPNLELSIELFPPKSPQARETLFGEVARLGEIRASHFSVTSGAGGNAALGTVDLVQTIRDRFGARVAPHITCAAASRDEVDALARRYWESGVRRVVALRGDAPGVNGTYVPRDDGYAYAADLVAGLRRIGDFDIAVGCYPEVHPQATSAEADLDCLRRKVDAGATHIISQYCFDTDRVLRFRDRLVREGIGGVFVPGIMPIHNFAQISRFSGLCGATIPAWLADLFAGLEGQPQMANMVAASVAAEQCRRLAAEGLLRQHIYALNRAELTLAICRLLGHGSSVRRAA